MCQDRNWRIRKQYGVLTFNFFAPLKEFDTELINTKGYGGFPEEALNRMNSGK